MSNKMALDALTAIQDAIGMPTSGDSSDFVWPKSTMRHPGETAYGWICEKHGLGYQSGCICCAGDLKAYREQKDREARYAREDAIRDASKKVRAAIAALQASPQPANLADTPTPKPQGGMWTLTAPDGRTYQADSPLRCCGLEQRERVPADVAMARIFRAASEPDDSELLDWLDATNKRFKMGWKVGVAPAGNCSVQSVIFLGNSEPVTIRAAIRAALLATPPKD